jgi:putative phosphoesterase
MESLEKASIAGRCRMLLGIISDTHDRLARTRVAVELLRTAGAEALVHCGDFTGPEILSACSALPLYFVFGNNDSHRTTSLQMAAVEVGAVCLGWGGVVELAGKRVGVTHGHTLSDYRRVLADRPDYLLSGHSHIAHDQREGQVHRINPGALHRALVFSVALLEVESGELRFLEVPK